MVTAASGERSSVRKLYLLTVTAAAAGRNAYFIVVAWIAVATSQSSSSVALLLGLGSLAELLTSNAGGALADRFDRRIICVVCDFLRILLAPATGLALFRFDPMMVLCASWSAFSIVDRTYLTASQALIPSLVEPTELTPFNSTSYLCMQGGNLIAAVATGMALSAIGREMALLTAGAFFVPSCVGMVAVYRYSLSLWVGGIRGQRVGVYRLDALPVASTLGALKVSASIYALNYVTGMLVSVFASAFVLQELGGDAWQFGALEAAWAAGSIAGCGLLLLPHARRCRQSALIHVAFSGTMLGCFWCFQNLPVALVQLVFLGVSYNVVRILIDVEVQRLVPNEELGRARGKIHTICVAIGLLAYAIIALLGNSILPSSVFASFGATMIAAALGFGLLARNSRIRRSRGQI